MNMSTRVYQRRRLKDLIKIAEQLISDPSLATVERILFMIFHE